MGLFKTRHSEVVHRGMPLFAWEKLFMFCMPLYTAFWAFLVWRRIARHDWDVVLFLMLTVLGTVIAFGWRCLLEVRLKYPLRWADSMAFYRANAMKRYPDDRWMRFWLITYRVVSGA